MIAYRFARASDIERFYEGTPCPTMRAVVVLMDEEPAVVIGVARRENCAQLFGEFRETFRPHLSRMATLRAIKLALSIVKESPLPVYAIAEESEPDSERLLQRMGFVHCEDRVYRWPS